MQVKKLLDSPAEEATRLYRKLALALEASQMGIWEHNIATDEVVWDRQLCEIYGVEYGIQVTWVDHVHPKDRDQAMADFAQAKQDKSSYSSQFRVLLPDGKVRHVRSRAHYYEDQDGAAFFIGAEWDVTADVLMQEELVRRAQELEESHRLLEHSALHDFLSGLPNRRGLERFLASRKFSELIPTAVLHVDLDHFKEVNDRLGHEIGDRVLCAFAVRLAAILPGNGFAARMGGDEFIVVLEDTSLQRSQDFAEIVLDAAAGTRSDVNIGGIEVGASIGLAFGKAPFEQLLAEADLALYKAKDDGRRRYHVFDDFLKKGLMPIAMRH